MFKNQIFHYSIGKKLLIVIFFFSLITNTFSQKIINPKDTVKVINSRWSQTKKATLYSTFLPGLGQISNKKYWKVPLIYSLLGGLGYLIYTNNNDYEEFRNAITYRYDGVSGNETYSQFSVDNLIVLKRTYQRYRDFSILGASLVYLLQIVDANVDAHLLNFDVENISMRISPEISPNNPYGNNNYFGINLTLTPKNSKP
jgi:hypothetical protein